MRFQLCNILVKIVLKQVFIHHETSFLRHLFVERSDLKLIQGNF